MKISEINKSIQTGEMKTIHPWLNNIFYWRLLLGFLIQTSNKNGSQYLKPFTDTILFNLQLPCEVLLIFHYADELVKTLRG